MTWQLQRSFLFVWILVMLAMAAVLSLTISGCSSQGANTGAQTSAPATTPTGDVAAAAPQAGNSGCIDSDGGKDTTVRGKVTVGNMSFMDNCASPFVVEYYCENGQAENQNFRCEKECDKGACA